MISQKEQRDKGDKAEEKFKSWLDKHNIPYWYIRQDIDTFSFALKKYMTKRPDFMVLIPHVGFVLVDIKNKTPVKNVECSKLIKKKLNNTVICRILLISQCGMCLLTRVTTSVLGIGYQFQKF